MIISNSRKYIFIHIHKTAGTSVSKALEPSQQWNDLVLGSTVLGGAINNLYRKQFKLDKHSRAADVRRVVGEEIWHEYFVFTFVRHPYDRAISLYTWIKGMVESKGVQRYLPKRLRKSEFWNWPGTVAFLATRSFSEFIRHPGLLHRAPGFNPQIESIADQNGKIIVHFVGKCEKIEDDFLTVCKRVGVEPLQLGIHNRSQGMKAAKPHVKKSDLELLYDRFRSDFEMLGYDADPERFLSAYSAESGSAVSA